MSALLMVFLLLAGASFGLVVLFKIALKYSDVVITYIIEKLNTTIGGKHEK